MIRRAVAALLARRRGAGRGAQTFAITGGTVALGDGTEPIPNGMVVVRDGRVVAAGDIRMKLPADTQVIDATGKWVTPGIVAGFSRLGLADVELSARGRRRHDARTGRSTPRSTSTGDQPARHDHRGQSRRRSDARDRRAVRPARASSPGKAR